MIVVDASVAVKWLLPELGSAEALEILEGADQLFAPAIILVEVTGAILRRFRGEHLPEEHARRAIIDWRRIIDQGAIELIATDELIAEATDLAFEARHALVDCLYLAAARRLHASVVTADVVMCERGAKVYDRIDLLCAVRSQ